MEEAGRKNKFRLGILKLYAQVYKEGTSLARREGATKLPPLTHHVWVFVKFHRFNPQKLMEEVERLYVL